MGEDHLTSVRPIRRLMQTRKSRPSIQTGLFSDSQLECGWSPVGNRGRQLVKITSGNLSGDDATGCINSCISKRCRLSPHGPGNPKQHRSNNNRQNGSQSQKYCQDLHDLNSNDIHVRNLRSNYKRRCYGLLRQGTSGDGLFRFIRRRDTTSKRDPCYRGLIHKLCLIRYPILCGSPRRYKPFVEIVFQLRKPRPKGRGLLCICLGADRPITSPSRRTAAARETGPA